MHAPYMRSSGNAPGRGQFDIVLEDHHTRELLAKESRIRARQPHPSHATLLTRWEHASLSAVPPGSRPNPRQRNHGPPLFPLVRTGAPTKKPAPRSSHLINVNFHVYFRRLRVRRSLQRRKKA